MMPTTIRRLRPRTPADWIALVFASVAGGSIAIADDWLTVIVSIVFFVLGTIYRLAPDTDKDGIPDHVERVRDRIFTIKPDVLLLLAFSFGLASCAAWSAQLIEVRAESTATGAIEWTESAGLSTVGDLASSAKAAGEVCYRRHCSRMSVTFDTAADGVVVCAHIGPFSHCESAP